MAHIPVAQQFHTLTSSVVTADLGSALANSGREVYTMQDIIDTVSYSGGSIDGSGTADTLAYFTDSNTIATLNSYLTNFSNATIKIGSLSAATGAYNTAYGVRAMDAVSTGANNTLIGAQAGNQLTSGNDNVLIGLDAGEKITTAHRNVALGYRALRDNVSGNNNIAIGYEAMEDPTDDSNNVAIGYRALNAIVGSNQLGYNVGIGYAAAENLTTGRRNFFGGWAGGQCTTADDNIALGYLSLYGNITGKGNISIGYASLLSSSPVGVDSYNTCVGHETGFNISSGKHNTLIGAVAGKVVTTGDNNTVVGYGASVSAAGIDNEVTLGDSSVTALRCAVNTITLISDERDKTDIVDIEYGLDYVNTLQPRQWTWNHRPEVKISYTLSEDGKIASQETNEVTSSRKGTKDVGFVAQELQSVDNDFLKLVNDANPDKLQASWVQLVPVLVKAIQELKEQLDNKQDK